VGSRSRNAASVEARDVPETDQLGGKVDRENSLTSESRQPRRGGRRPEQFETGSKKVRGRARKSLELIEAMYRAAEMGAAIDVIRIAEGQS
jgi:hypothetical protein